MVKIGIVKRNAAFLPEAYAYMRFFSLIENVNVDYYSTFGEADKNSDIVIVFLGFVPFWVKPKSKIVAEYHTLSTGKFPRIKNIIKRLINVRGDFYVFLNDFVRERYMFSKNENYVLRSMGFDESLRSKYKKVNKEYDFVYAGSVSRAGVIDQISRISMLGLSFAVVGNSAEEAIILRRLAPAVKCFGKINPDDCYRVISSSRFGLNFTPDEYPFNIQDSTKVIEYAALGLGVVTNSYKWVDSFERKIDAKFLRLNDIKTRGDVEDFYFKSGNVETLAWGRIMSDSGFLEKMTALVSDVARKKRAE